LIEAKVKRHLEKFALTAAEFIADEKAASENIFKSMIPADLEHKIHEFKNQLQNALPGLGDEIAAIDPTLKKAFIKTEQSLVHQFNILENKVSNALRQKQSILNNQFLSISENLKPGGTLQERKLNIIPFLIKYDWTLLEKLFRAINVNNHQHQLLEL